MFASTDWFIIVVVDARKVVGKPKMAEKFQGNLSYVVWKVPHFVTVFMQQLISTLFKGRKNIMWMVSHWPNFPTFFGIHQAMTEQRKWCCNVLIQWTLNQQQQEDAEGTAVISNHTYKAINSWVGNCELAIFITIKVTSVILIKDRHHIKFSLSFIVGNLISKITRTKLSTAELGTATWRSFHDSFSFCRDTTLKDWYLWSSLNPLTIFHMLYTNLGQLMIC